MLPSRLILSSGSFMRCSWSSFCSVRSEGHPPLPPPSSSSSSSSRVHQHQWALQEREVELPQGKAAEERRVASLWAHRQTAAVVVKAMQS